MYDYYNHFGDMPEVPDMEGMTPEEQEELATHTLLWGCVSYAVAILLGLLLFWLFSGCKGLEKVVTVEKTRTDTVFQKQTQLDSVWVWCHDSIVTKERSDTVTVERWHWSDRWRERVVRDTVYKSRVDTVPMPYPVVKMVEKELSMWQKVRMHAGEAVLAILGVGVVLAIVRRRIFGG